ncbi:MAG TPA: glycosyltransferase family 4 protein [Solirubrobacteraceae bacterium]|nr:glycosyltransferase family 4 protein [Solirubrobacteraceae bacterium]
MNVLYVSHTAEVSGGERSLLSLLARLPADVHAHVAAPRGALLDAVSELNVSRSEIRGTAGSLRLHPLHTPRALAEMSLAAGQVGRLAGAHRADVVHANSIRAGIVLALAPRLAGARLVHVRDCLPPGPVSSATLRLISARARVVVANSHYTAASVRRAAPRARVQVVHNPVDLERFDPQRIDRVRARARLGAAGERQVLLGVVAQLSPWKGQHVAVQALALACEQGLDAHLLLVGSAKFVASATRLDNEAYVERLRQQIADAGLQDRVSWLGERDDVPELVRALDILLLPSEEEPFGRALIEAMALGVPVLATNVGGPNEIVQDGHEGYLLPPHEPRAWAEAILGLARSPDRAAQMGQAGRARVRERFSAEHHLRAMLGAYRRATA